MAFDFPTAPAIGDSHTEGGVEYTYAGDNIWNLAGGGTMQDYVLKTGDTMSGGLRVKPDGVGGVRMSPGDAGRVGMFEFYDAADVRMGYIGWGNDQYIRLFTEANKKWDVQGSGSGGGFLMNENCGIHWASSSAQTDPYNFSEGICLYGYGGTSQFGFTITSGTLNYIVQNSGNQHCFRVGDEVIMTVKNDHVRIPGAGLRVEGGDLNVSLQAYITGKLHAGDGINIDGKAICNPVTAGANGYFIGDSWHGMCFDGAQTMEFIEYHGNFNFVKRTTGNTGGVVQASFKNGLLGPATNINVSWLNGFGGTGQFRVNPAMVSWKMENVNPNATINGNTSTKLCAYPTGVPAPWSTMPTLVRSHSSIGYADGEAWGFIQARGDGIWLVVFEGSQFGADDLIDCSITWAR